MLPSSPSNSAEKASRALGSGLSRRAPLAGLAVVLALATSPSYTVASGAQLTGSVQPAVSRSTVAGHHPAGSQLPVTLLFRPGIGQSDARAVERFMAARGFSAPHRLVHGAGVRFRGTVAQVESTFAVEIDDYVRADGRIYHANAGPITIPSAISSYVTGVLDLDDALEARPLVAFSPLGSTPPYTPAEMAHFYGVDQLNSAGFDGSGEKIGIISFATFRLSDVRTFESTFNLPASVVKMTTAPPLVQKGPASDVAGSTETTLDVTWSSAIAPGAEIDVVLAANSDWIGALDTMISVYDPDVISISWGSGDACAGSPGAASQDALHNAIVAMNARRIPILVASGDTGSRECSPANTSAVSASWPSTDPAVTAVGGTAIDPDGNGLPSVQTSWNCGGAGCSPSGSGGASGGGFSSHFAMPSFQTAIQGSNPGLTGPNRGVPDVALLGGPHGYVLRARGAWESITGTSAATPALAGIIATANQAHGSKLTDANAFLYSMVGGAHSPVTDISDGKSNGDYTAIAGWDAVTGLGAVDAVRLLYALGGCGCTLSAPVADFSVAPPSITKISPRFGSPGDTVTIFGRGLANLTAGQVTFGGVPATGLAGAPTSTRAQVTAPSGVGGLVPVVVSTSGGQTVPDDAARFSFAPVVSRVSPPWGSPGGGFQVTITGGNFGTGTPVVNFGPNNPGSQVKVLSSKRLTVTAPPGAGVVDVRVVSSSGQTSDVSGVLGSDSFSYAPVVRRISPGSGPASGQNNVTITGANFGTSTPNVAFGTSPASGVKLRSSTVLTATAPPGSGVVQVRVTAGGQSSDTGGIFGSSAYAYLPVITGISPSSGPAGGINHKTSQPVTVTIHGAGFGTAGAPLPVVAFGTVTAGTATRASDTQLSVQLPAIDSSASTSSVQAMHSGLVNVTVTTPAGTSLPTARSRFKFVDDGMRP